MFYNDYNKACLSLFIVAATAIIAALFPPVYALDFPAIPDGFRFINNIHADEHIAVSLLVWELFGLITIASWLGVWIYQNAPKKSAVRELRWNGATAQRNRWAASSLRVS